MVSDLVIYGTVGWIHHIVQERSVFGATAYIQ
jgi:hypothetical protein